MDQSLYHLALYASLPLLLFFGFHMLLARLPESRNFSNFLMSRRLMGAALLLLAANYSVHLFCALRLKDVNATILMNMATYFLCYWLFSSAMMTLLDNGYVTGRRFCIHIALWIAFSVACCSVVIFIPGTSAQNLATGILAAILAAYGLFLSVRLLRTYTKAIRMFENTHSDDIGAYIRWLSVFTYWAICYGVSCSLLTFLPSEYVFIWILSSIPFYIYLYCSYQNYIFFYEQVEKAFREDAGLPEEKETGGAVTEDIPAGHPDIARRIEEWIGGEGYRKPGITLNELSATLCTNRTYLSEHINRVYQMSFRDWISGLRIECAKRLMKEQPQMKIQEISEATGFLSISHFSRTFSDKEGCSPARWRKENCTISL